MKILLLDIETSPNLAHVWGLWDQNVSLNQLIESQTVLCWAAKWYQAKQVEFRSTFHSGDDAMVNRMHVLLDEADAVVHYNGKHFDIPHLNVQFIGHGFRPPSPFKQIDLLEVVRKQFKFPSNKLAYVGPALGVGAKIKHQGHELWTACLAGEEAAWNTMRKYCIQDTKLLEPLYDILKPWIPSHPSYAAMSGTFVCPKCGAAELVREGYAYTAQGKFQRYHCAPCGAWSRDTHREYGAPIAQVAASG